MTQVDPRYPIGRFRRESPLDGARRAELIDIIEKAPVEARAAVAGIREDEWDLSYREGGWTIRQVVHHIADSHLNAAIRIRLALTEPTPTITPYDEAAWALLPDVSTTSPETSLALLEALHRRWVDLLRGLAPIDFSRDFRHPEHASPMTIDDTLALYAWHGRHHIAHIRHARNVRFGAEGDREADPTGIGGSA